MDTIEQELELIANKHGGIVRPIDVVEFAKDPSTQLHGRFEWDNATAAHEYRLWQAREIINVYVHVEPRINEPVRVFVSLDSDRAQPGGGYRRLSDVLSDDEMIAQLLRQALRDLHRIKRNYGQLKQLTKVIQAVDELFAEHEQPATAAA